MCAARRRLILADLPPREPGFTTWHITFGTFCTRLHGGDRATVSRDQNAPGQPFIEPHEPREMFERDRARGPAVILSVEQCHFIEQAIPAICERGGWTLRTCSTSPPAPDEAIDGDHVHVLLDAPAAVHGKQVRELIKRWLTQALDQRWSKAQGGSWWAEGGSTKPVKDDDYRVNAHNYVAGQRATTE